MFHEYFLIGFAVLAFLTAAGVVAALSWRETARELVEWFRVLRRSRIRLMDLFLLVAACGLLFRLLVAVGWPWPGWVDSAVVFVTVSLAVVMVTGLARLLYLDLFERPRKRRGEILSSQRGEAEPCPGEPDGRS